ncbi:MAG TPA: tannase/feruloyl esterase family alpha/beta hydrolase, partial [Caulobacteraceae bacterium]|nr:tannase/feruloyl esterase family alpha/beta hydrolase [Caulobacteraceae bacterium]
MTRWMIVLAAWALALACAAAAPAARAETTCDELGRITLPHAEVTSAASVALGQGQACKIEVTSRPTPDSDIRIEVWIPIGSAWNGRYVQLGNGGFAGQIPSGQIKAMAARGYAAAGTDDGHQRANLTDASWALGHREKVVDFAWRALKETTTAAKALIAAQKGSPLEKSYFYGCSDGGREALMEAQRFPSDFDGIVAGAPANDMSDLFALSAAMHQALAKPGGFLGPDQRSLLQSASLAKCGEGGFIPDPASCRFDPDALRCTPGEDQARCLTPAQVASAKVIYGGLRDPRNGRLLYPGYSPGAEAIPGSWSLWD